MAHNALFVFLSIITLNLLVETSAVGFSVELMHRDHTKSPLYNPNHSLTDRVREAVHHSNARAKAISRSFFYKPLTDADPFAPSVSPYPSPSDFPSPSAYPPPSDSPSSPKGNIETDIIQNGYNYIMSINLGTPSKEIIAIADTGSDLIWATCEPCEDCYKQDAPRFDPSSSSSYSNLSCSSEKCNELDSSQMGCDKSDKCLFIYGYGDGSLTSGNLAIETLTFNTTSHSTINFPKVSFGCSHTANGTFDSRSAGLVGLGGGPLSLISQLGSSINHRFSYCLIPMNDANVTTSTLSFGSDATISGHDVATTELLQTIKPTFYTVTLDGIKVANKSLDSIQSNYMIVDSGTTLTYLDSGILDSLIETLSNIISLPPVKDDQGLFSLCFDESKAGSDFEYPDITFKMGNATVVLKPYNAFIQKDTNIKCLAMASFKSDTKADQSLQILGNIAQQNFHVGYDLGVQKISFAPADCTKY